MTASLVEMVRRIAKGAVRLLICSALFAAGSHVRSAYQFPRTGHAQPAVSRFDLDQDGAEVGDNADVPPDVHLVP